MVSAALGLAGCTTGGGAGAGPAIDPRPAGETARPARAETPVGQADSPGAVAIDMVVVSRDVSPQDEGFYQYNIKFLENVSRIIEPLGKMAVRMELPTTQDGSPPVINGIIWETFEPWVSSVPDNFWHPYTKVLNKKLHGELLDCTVPLRLPRDDMAGFLPAGAPSARVTLEFRPDGRSGVARQALPELPFRATAGGLVPPQTPAEKMKLESVADSGAEIAVQVGLQDGRGEFTLPAGDFSLSATTWRAGETEGPANPESYTALAGIEAPLRIGKRFGVWKGNQQVGARIEYWQRLTIPRERLAEAVPAGTTKVWLRVGFRGVDGTPLAQTIAVPLRSR